MFQIRYVVVWWYSDIIYSPDLFLRKFIIFCRNIPDFCVLNLYPVIYYNLDFSSVWLHRFKIGIIWSCLFYLFSFFPVSFLIAQRLQTAYWVRIEWAPFSHASFWYFPPLSVTWSIVLSIQLCYANVCSLFSCTHLGFYHEAMLS